MAQMIQVIMRLSQVNGVVDNPNFVNTATRVQGVTKGLTYPPASPTMLEMGIPHYRSQQWKMLSRRPILLLLL